MIDIECEQGRLRRRRDLMVRILISAFVIVLIVAVTIFLTLAFSVRPTIDTNSGKREAQNLCVARLQADYDVAVARAVLSPANSAERTESIRQLDLVIDRLDHIDRECFAASPATPSSGGG